MSAKRRLRRAFWRPICAVIGHRLWGGTLWLYGKPAEFDGCRRCHRRVNVAEYKAHRAPVSTPEEGERATP